jgi:hypothetical protein
MERYAIILLLLIAGCMSSLDVQENTTYTRSAIDARVELTNDAINKSGGGVIFVLSDYEKAARTSMQVGQTLVLPTSPQATIILEESTSQEAVFTVNNQTQTIAQGQQAVFSDGELQLYVART